MAWDSLASLGWEIFNRMLRVARRASGKVGSPDLAPLPAQVPEEQRSELCRAHEEELTAQYEAEAAATRPPLEAARGADEESVFKQCALHLCYPVPLACAAHRALRTGWYGTNRVGSIQAALGRSRGQVHPENRAVEQQGSRPKPYRM